MKHRCQMMINHFQSVLDAGYEIDRFVDLTKEEKVKLKDVLLVVNEAFKRTKTIFESIEQRPEPVFSKKIDIPQDDLFSWAKHDAKVAVTAKQRKIENKLAKLQRELAALTD